MSKDIKLYYSNNIKQYMAVCTPTEHAAVMLAFEEMHTLYTSRRKFAYKNSEMHYTNENREEMTHLKSTFTTGFMKQ